ncbi:hypothetical protein P0D69_22265 [Paraburkholderia sediminicola]|uniref:hypothetical protein n=1 Tax=Paraburkholderia sediminicola TaxID=458836 RepID=UPI0038B7BAB3
MDGVTGGAICRQEPLLESDWGNEKSGECATRHEIFGKKNKKGLPVGQAFNVVFDVSDQFGALGCGGRI